jgi:hypothetical protein
MKVTEVSYKLKLRKGKEKAYLERLEEASNLLSIMRLS